jgi:serine/threonine protein kinase
MLIEGQKFERCRINRYLGSGVSGESYEAEDTMLQRKITFKLIHPWTPLTDAARRQFFREMQDISTLEHTYLANVLDYGEYNGQLFVARRYIGPGSLLGSEGRYWYKPPLAVAEAIQLAHQLAQALEYIHSRGYVHGSLTMANIQVLRGPQSEAEEEATPFLITDVGLASFVRRFGRPHTTLLPATAAPEQLGGRTVAASDQYALAVILYFWLTARLPFVGSPDAIEQQKLSESFTSPRTLNEQITAEQANIIKQALSVYPEERYPSILTFTQALQATLPDKTISPAPGISAPPTPAFLETPQPQQHSLPPTDSPEMPSARESAPDSSTSNHLLDITLHATPPNPLLDVTLHATEASPDLASSSSITRPQDHTEELLSALVNPPLTAQDPSTPPPFALNGMHAVSTATPPAGSQKQEPTRQPSTQATVQKESAYLLITARGSKNPRKVKLEGDEITIGRAGSSDILLDQDTLTSRHQALLKYENSNYVLYDQHSAYGTTVNGQQLTAGKGYPLHEGDKIGIGSYELVFTRRLSMTPADLGGGL